jgi:hypothetical protein
MKKIYLFFLIFLGISVHAQKLSFDYDEAGNQILRSWCANCLSKSPQDPIKNFDDLEDIDLEKFHPEDEISYYPNPVQEQLFLKWKLVNEKKVNEIRLYNLNGQLLKVIKNLSNSDNYIFSFGDLPQGLYNLILIYNNEEEKPIKIIKK